MAGTIRKIIPARSDTTKVSHVVVATNQGRYLALLGPGLYKTVTVEELSLGDKVFLTLTPVPTMMGRVSDGPADA